jgi:hypothetical protein
MLRQRQGPLTALSDLFLEIDSRSCPHLLSHGGTFETVRKSNAASKVATTRLEFLGGLPHSFDANDPGPIHPQTGGIGGPMCARMLTVAVIGRRGSGASPVA